LDNYTLKKHKMAEKLISQIPEGPLAEKWTKHKAQIRVVSPANKRKLEIIVIGTGLGGAAAAASLGELGYNVKVFCISDSPRRAHSIAAQGGINAAKNYTNDNDSIYRLFYDTIKGGDYRAREANVYRLAEVSTILSTSALHRVFLLHVTTVDCWITDHLVVLR
jgi:succinate dehydrogenase / fumarate reductase flavoprotein subunit